MPEGHESQSQRGLRVLEKKKYIFILISKIDYIFFPRLRYSLNSIVERI